MNNRINPVKWRVSSSPHIRTAHTTRAIMLDVVIALIPAGIAGVWIFGARAAVIIALSVASAVFWEALAQKIMKKPITVSDLSAVITGLLLAYNLPTSAPFWVPVVGTGVAIILVKQIFGGIGHNFVNPALAARAILIVSWTGLLSGTAFVDASVSAAAGATDAASFATPLATTGASDYSLWQLFIGDIPGCIGEVSKLALLAGAAYLLWRRVIDWRIPFSMLGTVFIMSWISSGTLTGDVSSPVYQMLSGGLILGAFFMATDYATSPITATGRIIMGVGCGLLLFLIRSYSANYPEGFTFAILIMNLATPLIDRFTRPKVFGR